MASGTVACGSSSPTAPGGATGGGGQTNTGSGATINGSISGAIPTTATLGFAGLDGPGLTVTIVGTNLSAVVDASGNFTINNVPDGDVQLRFSGTGTDATLTVSGVITGEEIRLTVTISGGSASVQTVVRQDLDKKVEIEGRVTSGACALFVVNGMNIATNAATQYVQGTCASIVSGVKVHIKGTRQADGSVLAQQIKVDMPPIKDTDDFELSGAVTAATGCASFTVNGTVITTNSATQFKFGACADVVAGSNVAVKGTVTGGVYLAERVEITKSNWLQEVELFGEVTAGACSSFTLKGMTVHTNSKTQFKNAECADIKPGVEVEVKGSRLGDGPVTATRVTFEKAKIENVEVEGEVTAGACGSFTVAGVVVTTSASTQFKEGVCSDIKPGVRVEVRGTRSAGIAGTGPIAASRVTFDKDEAELYGKITAGGCGSFTMSTKSISEGASYTVTTSSSTEFKNGVCSDIKPDEYVKVKGMKSGTTVAASRVEFEEENIGNDFYLSGKVMSGACGSFTISGPAAITDYITWTIATTSTTVFKNGVCSNIAPGVKVEVKATKTGASSATAIGVQFHD